MLNKHVAFFGGLSSKLSYRASSLFLNAYIIPTYYKLTFYLHDY